ncbi:MAG: cupredoxin domain-containing protein [Acidimicrobiia bacterium]|nr:cupredoxin domain-containing protein [Acidimicrobiia bacterium]
MKRAFLVLTPLLVVALLLAGCGVKTTHKVVSAAAVPGGTGFSGGPIRVKKGDKVVITVGNRTERTHGFAIDAFGIKDTVDPGKRVQVKFTPTAAGRYVVYCQLHPTHKPTELIVS